MNVLSEGLALQGRFTPVGNDSGPKHDISAYELFDDDEFAYVVCSDYFGSLTCLKADAASWQVVEASTVDTEASLSTIAMNQFAHEVFITGNANGSLQLWRQSDSRLTLSAAKPEAHAQAIIKAKWVNEHEVITIGMDDLLRTFDATSLSSISYICCQDSMPTAFDYIGARRLILVGHVGGTIKLFDGRARSKVSEGIYKSHNGYVSCIAANQADGNVFASSDYSGVVKIWDLRKNFPLYSIVCHKEKVFDCVWKGMLTRSPGLVHGRRRRERHAAFV